MARCIGVSEDGVSRLVVSPARVPSSVTRQTSVGPHLGVADTRRGDRHDVPGTDADIARAADGQPVGKQACAVADELRASRRTRRSRWDTPTRILDGHPTTWASRWPPTSCSTGCAVRAGRLRGDARRKSGALFPHCVLGLDELRRRIDEAAALVGLGNLALSPQCGFASIAEGGNHLTDDDQYAKLRLVADTARAVWG